MCVSVCMSVCRFVRVFGPCYNVEAKGLEQHFNLLRSSLPKREIEIERGGDRQRERGKKEREGQRKRDRDSSIGTQQSGDMAAAWLSVIMDELRSSCIPFGAWFDSLISTLCCVQACSQTPLYRDMDTH